MDPPPGYALQPENPLSPAFNASLYNSLKSAQRTLLTSHTLPPRSGHALPVSAGSIIRISTPSGPQVGDLNLWNLQNPSEHFWASRSRQIYGAHVTTGDKLLSRLPWLRPMVTIIGDTLTERVKAKAEKIAQERGVPVNSSYGVHDLMGTRCDPYGT